MTKIGSKSKQPQKVRLPGKMTSTYSETNLGNLQVRELLYLRADAKQKLITLKQQDVQLALLLLGNQCLIQTCMAKLLGLLNLPFISI